MKVNIDNGKRIIVNNPLYIRFINMYTYEYVFVCIIV